MQILHVHFCFTEKEKSETAPDWRGRYMQRGAEAVHAANPRALVIMGGLSYDYDLSFLAARQVGVSFAAENKLVFEVHWYSFSDARAWEAEGANEVCGRAARDFARRGGFLLARGFPLFLSEFGADSRGGDRKDNRYFPCAAAVGAEHDVDWAYWALQGSYALRQGVAGMDEVYGVLDWSWSKPRNATVLPRIQALQRPLQGQSRSDIIAAPDSHGRMLTRGACSFRAWLRRGAAVHRAVPPAHGALRGAARGRGDHDTGAGPVQRDGRVGVRAAVVDACSKGRCGRGAPVPAGRGAWPARASRHQRLRRPPVDVAPGDRLRDARRRRRRCSRAGRRRGRRRWNAVPGRGHGRQEHRDEPVRVPARGRGVRPGGPVVQTGHQHEARRAQAGHARVVA